MNLFIPNEKHIEILDEIGRWKVISLKELFSQVGSGTLYSPFCKTLRTLEREGLVKPFFGHRGKKYFSLSNVGGKYSKYSSPYIENENELRHDLIVSCVLRELLKFKNFKSGYVLNEDLDVVPDALIYAVKNEREYNLAVEVELHQKSKKRVVDKFSRYGSSKRFNYVMYATNKRSIYDSYRKLLLDMNHKIQSQIMILFDENMNSHKFDYLNSLLLFNGTEKKFLEVFG